MRKYWIVPAVAVAAISFSMIYFIANIEKPLMAPGKAVFVDGTIISDVIFEPAVPVAAAPAPPPPGRTVQTHLPTPHLPSPPPHQRKVTCTEFFPMAGHSPCHLADLRDVVFSGKV